MPNVYHDLLRTLAAASFCAIFALAACSPKGSIRSSSDDTSPADDELLAGAVDGEGAALGGDVDGQAVDVQEARIRGKEFGEIPDLEPVFFDYDMYSLTRKARVALRDNAAYLKGHPDLEVLVEGHCDERGTTEYNLALGQKRAKAVRDYYIRVGVPGKSVATISFGEERPLCKEAEEDCWLRNRRGETKIRAQISSNSLNSHDDIP